MEFEKMTSKFDEEKPVLPKEHWVCQNCSAKSNLIRSHDISRPTFCKPCMISLRENLKHVLHDKGIKFMLESILNILEKESSYSQKKYIVRHINSVLEDRLEDWNIVRHINSVLEDRLEDWKEEE